MSKFRHERGHAHLLDCVRYLQLIRGHLNQFTRDLGITLYSLSYYMNKLNEVIWMFVPPSVSCRDGMG